MADILHGTLVKARILMRLKFFGLVTALCFGSAVAHSLRDESLATD